MNKETTETKGRKARLVVLCSGGGTNFQCLIDACQTDQLHAEIVHMFYDRKAAYAATRADNSGIPKTRHNIVDYRKRLPDAGEPEQRERYFADLADKIAEQRPDLVVCAGWMLIVTGTFLRKLTNASIPVINLHPSLPGAIIGANAIERAFEAFQRGEMRTTGIMVHFVIEAVDEGEPIVWEEVEMRDGDTLEALQQRMHEVEWRLIVQATKMACEKTLAGAGAESSV